MDRMELVKLSSRHKLGESSRAETAVSGKSFDSDNSGGIEFDEFIQMTAEWLEPAVLPKSPRYW